MGTARTQRNIVEGGAPAPQGVGSAIPVPGSEPSAAEDRSAMPRSGTRSNKEGPAMSAAVRDAATVSAVISRDGGPMSASASPDKAAAAARTAGKGESGVTPEEGKTVGTAALPRAERPSARKIRINFRPFLFAACGLIFGIMLYHRIAFGGFVPSDALFFALFLPLALVRRTRRTFLCALAVLAVGASCGAGASHLYAQRFCGGVPAGEYVVSGTVVSVAAGNGYCTATMGSLSFDGVSVGGKLQVTLPVEWVDPAERLSFTADVARTPLPDGADAYAQTLYASDVRYTASCSHMMSEGRSVNPFLRLNAAIHALLTEHMERDEAELCYALLTGNSRNLDGGFLEETRSAGIAHIFAVSGLHIGILYGAALVVFRFCRRYAALPAIAAAVCYSALCGFTVSSVRAVVMCAVLGLSRMTGRKYDFLSSLSLAAVVVLVAMPAQWLTAGFRLSFGACLGLALYSGSLRRALHRLPVFLSSYLSATIAVQLATFPVMVDLFGYFSLWGFLLNFLLIPLLPVLFLGLLACMVPALLIPPAAAVFLAVPEGMFSALLFVFSWCDFSFVLAGFSLGAGSAVFLSGVILLSGRVRLSKAVRAAAAAGGCVLFALCVFAQNAVVTGCKITVYDAREGTAALVRTPQSAVLIIDGDITLSACEDFLSRTYAGELDVVAVLGGEPTETAGTAAALPTACVRLREEAPTGLRETDVAFGERFCVGALQFVYEGDEKLVLLAEGLAVEFDFEHPPALGADLCIQKGDGGLNYFLKDGIIRSL